MPAESFIGTIAILSFNRLMSGWLPCDGRSLPINQNQALYSLLGTRFGGDGRTNFNLPNLNTRAIVGANLGAGSYPVGASGGANSVSLTTLQIPSHIHSVAASVVNPPNSRSVVGNFLGIPQADPAFNPPLTNAPLLYGPPSSALIPLAPVTVANTGIGNPHENRQPSLALAFQICVTGLYPPRQ
jgi:microcystin-dependent protein